MAIVTPDHLIRVLPAAEGFCAEETFGERRALDIQRMRVCLNGKHRIAVHGEGVGA